MLSIGLLLLSAVVQVNGRSLGKYARVVRPEIAAANEYDFIIAGGGIAGLTVADRLTEDPDSEPRIHLAVICSSLLTPFKQLSSSSSMAHLIMERTLSSCQGFTIPGPTFTQSFSVLHSLA